MDHGVKAVIGDVPLHQYASRINRWMASAQCGELTALGTGEFETSNPWTTAVRCVTHWLNLGYCCLSASQMRLGTKAPELSKFRKHRSNSPTTNVVRQVPRHKTGAGALPLILRLGGQVHLRAVATLSVDRARSTIWSWSGGWVNKFLFTKDLIKWICTARIQLTSHTLWSECCWNCRWHKLLANASAFSLPSFKPGSWLGSRPWADTLDTCTVRWFKLVSAAMSVHKSKLSQERKDEKPCALRLCSRNPSTMVAQSVKIWASPSVTFNASKIAPSSALCELWSSPGRGLASCNICGIYTEQAADSSLPDFERIKLPSVKNSVARLKYMFWR